MFNFLALLTGFRLQLFDGWILFRFYWILSSITKYMYYMHYVTNTLQWLSSDHEKSKMIPIFTQKIIDKPVIKIHRNCSKWTCNSYLMVTLCSFVRISVRKNKCRALPLCPHSSHTKDNRIFTFKLNFIIFIDAFHVCIRTVYFGH